MTETNVADTLDRAADYIEAHGWCRGRVKDAEGRVCVIGALCEVSKSDRLIANAMDAMDCLVGGNAIQWNNNVAFDAAEVVNHFRKASEMARAAAPGGSHA